MAMVNQGVASVLADSMAVYQGGEPFAVIFERAAVDPLGLVESAGPTASFHGALAPGLQYDSELTINGTAYRVVGGLEPDASGWLTVSLRLAH